MQPHDRARVVAAHTDDDRHAPVGDGDRALDQPLALGLVDGGTLAGGAQRDENLVPISLLSRVPETRKARDRVVAGLVVRQSARLECHGAPRARATDVAGRPVRDPSRLLLMRFASEVVGGTYRPTRARVKRAPPARA
jgi:hypothetical protein